jgi:competence protein ComEC
MIALLLLLLLLTGCTTAPVATEPTAAPTAAPTETVAVTEPPETEAPTEPAKEGLTVHFVDVGQADGMVLECGGEYAVIDGGYPAGGDKMVEYMTALGVEELKLVVATHMHGDHIGGLPTVLNTFPTETVWSNPVTFSNDYVREFQNAVAAQRIPLYTPQVGEMFELGEATITVIGPVRTNYEDLNDTSLVLMVQYGDIRFLFTGDMESVAEQDLLNSGADLKADVLKVGHHGSYSSTSYVFLREVMPTYGVISCGANNDYGHPHKEPVSRLKDADVIIFRTDKMYDIVAFTDGTEIEFSWGNKFAKPWTPGDE